MRPWPRITVQRAPGFSVGLSASSTCPSIRGSAWTWTRLNPFEANGAAVHRRRSVLLRPSVSTAPGAQRYRSHQHEERQGLVGACREDLGLGGCRDSVPRRDETQAFPEGEVQAAVVDGGCDVPEVPVVLEQCTTPLDGGVPAGGTAGHRDMR